MCRGTLADFVLTARCITIYPSIRPTRTYKKDTDSFASSSRRRRRLRLSVWSLLLPFFVYSFFFLSPTKRVNHDDKIFCSAVSVVVTALLSLCVCLCGCVKSVLFCQEKSEKISPYSFPFPQLIAVNGLLPSLSLSLSRLLLDLSARSLTHSTFNNNKRSFPIR